MFWRSVSEKVIDSPHMSLHSMERAQCIRFSCLTGAGMSSCDTEASGIILLHRQGKVNKSRDVGLVEPDVLETGSGLDVSQHPPAIKVMSRAANRSLNQSPLRVISSRRWRGTWKSSSSKASLNGVGPWPRLVLRRIFCINRCRSVGISCPRVSRCTCAAL